MDKDDIKILAKLMNNKINEYIGGYSKKDIDKMSDSVWKKFQIKLRHKKLKKIMNDE